MIPDQWYAILETREIKAGHLVGITRLGEKMVVWRDSRGQVSCQADFCPHRGCAFSVGKLEHDHLQCPFHGFEYDSTGKCVLIPANGKSAPVPKVLQVKTYIVREDFGFIWIWWGEPRDEYPDLPFFDDLGEEFSFSTDTAHWPVHYSRAIENQLDVFHLPFVHNTTIGRGNRTISSGPLVKLDGEKMDIWVFSQLDQGEVALKPDQLPEPARPPFLRFIFPNIWMNRISAQMRIVVAFVPIDDENTLFYLRYYQSFIRIPILRDIVNWTTKIFSRVILHQDEAVVLSQRPIKTDLKMGEKLIVQDRPIIQYRAHRRELIDQAQNRQNGGG